MGPCHPNTKRYLPNCDQIFDQHALWLRTGGKQGEPAILPNHDFQGLNLSNVVLKRANLEGANFKKANLAGANLKQASLRGANFSEADITETDFQDADLENADLTTSLGFNALTVSPCQFGRLPVAQRSAEI